MRYRPDLFCSLFIALAMTTCCGVVVAPPSDEITDPVLLMNTVDARLAELESARFRVVTEYYGTQTRGANFRQVVLVRRPEDIHIQILSPFGQTLQTLVTNGQRLALYDLEQQVYYSGSPTPENLARILPFYMTAADIARVLMGGPPSDQLQTDSDGFDLEWDGDEGRYRLTVDLVVDGGYLELGINHGDWIMESAKRFDAHGEPVFELRTGDNEAIGETMLPMRLRFLLYYPEEIDMSLEVERAELNVALPDSLFVLEPPRGVDQIDLDQ